MPLQAAATAGAQQWQEAEGFFLKAKRPDAALAMYREAGQWQAAIKLAEAYLPNSVQVRQMRQGMRRGETGHRTVHPSP